MLVLKTKIRELNPKSMGISKDSMPRINSSSTTPARPGTSKGRVTRDNTFAVEAPLPKAASSRVGSILRMVAPIRRKASVLMLTPSTQIIAGSE